MITTRRSLALSLVILTLGLQGCGKKAPPEPPPDAEKTYPRPYPHE
ncbi:MAG TPA: hypothetical protein VKT70_09055 [Stellaceae bacterium]|nr:hypothetical protein [Stellaceae bacterium]